LALQIICHPKFALVNFQTKLALLKCWHLGRPYGAKSDIWSMGCVLYELVELKKAYEGESLSSLLLRIARVKIKMGLGMLMRQYSTNYIN